MWEMGGGGDWGILGEGWIVEEVVWEVGRVWIPGGGME